MAETPSPPNHPFVTVVITTRNRPAYIAGAVRSVLRNDYPCFNLIVVDQSDDCMTENVLSPFMANPHFRYIKTASCGSSVGRNIGIGQARGEFIAITDDDAEAPANWLNELIKAFSVDQRVGVVFGNVLPLPCDPDLGFVPSYVRKEPVLVRSISQKHRAEGISCCMALRRSVWQELRGFDPALGSGAYLEAAEETDFAIRCLLKGHWIYETPKMQVVHHGFRLWEEGRIRIRAYLFGVGAMFAKHIKCGHLSVTKLLMPIAWRWAFRSSAVNLGNRSHRGLRLISFMRGLFAGLMVPVDRKTGHYRVSSHAA